MRGTGRSRLLSSPSEALAEAMENAVTLLRFPQPLPSPRLEVAFCFYEEGSTIGAGGE